MSDLDNTSQFRGMVGHLPSPEGPIAKENAQNPEERFCFRKKEDSMHGIWTCSVLRTEAIARISPGMRMTWRKTD